MKRTIRTYSDGERTAIVEEVAGSLYMPFRVVRYVDNRVYGPPDYYESQAEAIHQGARFVNQEVAHG